MSLCRPVFIVLLMFAQVSIAAPRLEAIDAAIAGAEHDRALTLIESELAATPDNPALRYRRARVLGYTGNDAAALRDLDALRRDFPQDVDYAFARAQLLARQGRDDDALNDLNDAVALAPDYEAVWKLRHRLLLRTDDEEGPTELERVSRDAALRFPEATWWQVKKAPAAPDWTLVVGAGFDELDNNAPSWSNQFVQAIHDQGGRYLYRVGIARSERFNNTDLALSLGGDIRFADRWTAGVDINIVGDADFQPNEGYSGHIAKGLDGGWALTARVSRRAFESASVNSVGGIVEKYVGHYRFAYSINIAHLQGASNSLGHSLTANWYYNERASLGLSINAGEEAESIGPGRVLETDVQGVTLSGRRQITDRLGVQWWIGTQEQGDFYRRRYLGMALTLRL